MTKMTFPFSQKILQDRAKQGKQIESGGTTDRYLEQFQLWELIFLFDMNDLFFFVHIIIFGAVTYPCTEDFDTGIAIHEENEVLCDPSNIN